ncbi:inovirus-type Gp2 protein [Nitratidesulfovibrio liaohensis]|uniref:Inovirus Gp2 family protein n=1 Tax=Nitratidesulfovibrio liaohensis TaxID=2604158 RepID=A0ABY9R1P2_9BACT|nr:inovirus-type Gp2 protein [Nitratidesulfovibrio liaohensis]WMW64694.1 inovirus Gp2 family protein [Nitratidesulfovibrio liaohensis]
MHIEENIYRNYQIQAYPTMPCRTDILDAIIDRIEHMTQRFSRVLFIRFDLRLPRWYACPITKNPLITFLNSFGQHLRRKDIAFQYAWVREQSREKHQHYHVMLLLNGNLTKSSWNHMEKAGQLWQKALGIKQEGLLHRCETARNGSHHPDFIHLDRHDACYERDIERCVEWASYLAKTRTKGYAPLHVREWGASTLR